MNETQAEIAEAITEAIGSLATEQGQFVRLCEVRWSAAWAGRASQDQVLAEMYKARKINLIPHSSPRAMNDDDRDAALHIGGRDKTLVSLV